MGTVTRLVTRLEARRVLREARWDGEPALSMLTVVMLFLAGSCVFAWALIWLLVA